MSMVGASQEMPNSLADLALALKRVTPTDLLRLKAIARLHARGLPPEVEWTDLLQEAFARVLDGSRICPEGVPMVVFLAGVMRSIRADHYRRARRTSALLPLMAGLELPAAPESEAGDPTPDPERGLIAMQQLGQVRRLFAGDQRALQILEGLFEGGSAEEIRARYGMSTTEYDSTRRRIRRTLLREGLRWGGHEE